MSKTTGVVLAMGGVTIVNNTVFHNQPMNWRIPVATGLAAVGFSAAERAWPTGAQILAWTAFLTVMLTRVNPHIPSPVESAIDWWNQNNSSASSPSAKKPGGSSGGSMEA
jgi:hypothetical protein